jgi:hypothetical protein
VIAEIIYIIFCLALAYWNYRQIARDKVINHDNNGLMHIVCWIIINLVFYLSPAYKDSPTWLLSIALPFIGRLFFDSSLSLMRGLPLDYVSKTPKSIIDKFEKSIFGMNGLLPKLIYLVIIIALNIIYYAR